MSMEDGRGIYERYMMGVYDVMNFKKEYGVRMWFEDMGGGFVDD